jgi:osmotically-inducible protein OsmY
MRALVPGEKVNLATKLAGWTAALGALLPLSGCELAIIGAATAAYSIAEDRRTSGTQVEDETIQVRAQSRVNERFGDKAHVNVIAFNRMALITGEAPDEAARSEIGKIVLAVPSVKSISNEIQLGQPTTRASRINDEIITTKIKGRLIDNEKLSVAHVKVVTEAGVVFLLGLVTEQEAALAVEIARTTGGVLKVVKLFEYCRPTDEVCRPRQAAQKPAA